MRIGLKLDIDFAANPFYRRLYGSCNVPVFLRSLGFHGIETPVGPETSEADVLDHARICSQAGLAVSLHPYTEAAPQNPGGFEDKAGNVCRDYFERLFELSDEIARMQRSAVVVNVHSAAGPKSVPRSHLVERSIAFFDWARSFTQSHYPNAQPVAELQIAPNPDEDMMRIGDSYDELLAVVRQSGTPACLDLGHAAMNIQRFGGPLEPPAALLRQVVHVHCHDVNGEDHLPLSPGDRPWRKLLNLLIQAGFDQTIILEVPPANFLNHGGLDALTRSIELLKEASGRSSGT